MKASLKLREEELKPPLIRAKLPISVLGLPLISGAVSGGGAADLALHLRTALPSGPSLKLTYRPSASSFSFSLKSGVGSWGSPDRSPLLISAHLSLPCAGSPTPSFTIQLKPQIGDFILRKSAASAPVRPKENGGGIYHPLPVSNPANPSVDSLLSSGAVLSAATVLPVASRAVVKLRWGVNFSEAAVARWRGLPYLTVEKIGIEMVESKVERKVDADAEDVSGVGLWMRKEMEDLRRESKLINESIEEMRRMITDGKSGDAGGGSRVSAFARSDSSPTLAAVRRS